MASVRRRVSLAPRASVKKLVPYVPGRPPAELGYDFGPSGPANLASNENPLGPSPLALEAARRRLSETNLYPDGSCRVLREKLAEKLGVLPDEILVGNGSNEVIEIVARTYLDSGDAAIYGRHAFIVYPLVTQAIGAAHVVSPMPDLVHDLEDMLSRITGKTKMIFIANPNNPTGTDVGGDDFERFAERVPKNVMVLVDEAYFEYAEKGTRLDAVRLRTADDSLVVVRTFSKIYGLAGLRVGYAVASRKTVDFLNRVREPFNVNSIAQAAACAALDDEEHVRRSREHASREREYFRERLARLGVGYAESRANFVLVDLERDAIPVYEALLRDGVITRPVTGYGLDAHLRVSFGLREENERFFDSLGRILGR